MIHGVRRPDEVSKLNLSNRVRVRIGALLKKNWAISLTVLELAKPGTAIESLLLDPTLLERASDLNQEALNTLANSRPEIPSELLAVADASDGFRVICLQEEFDAGEWGSPTLAENSHTSPSISPNATDVTTVRDTAVVSLSTRDVLPSQGLVRVHSAPDTSHALPGETLFSPKDIDRWRLKLVTASAASERLEAMRSLIFAPLSTSEKIDVVLQGLSDKDATIRSEAAGMLPDFGADRSFAENLAALNHSDPGRRVSAVEHLKKRAAQGPTELEMGALAICTLTNLKGSEDEAFTATLLDLVAECAPAVGRNSERVAEVVRLLCTMIATATRHGPSSREVDHALSHAQRLIRAFARAVPAALLPVLNAERERAAGPIVESVLLQTILDLTPAGAAEEDSLIKVAAAFLARDLEEGRDSRAIGARLVRRGEKALLALCDVFHTATGGAQKYFLILFDDIHRTQKLTPVGLDRAGRTILQVIESGQKGMRMAAMECHFVIDMELPEETRGKLTRAFLNSINDFTFAFDIEKAESAVARLGLPAAGPLLERISSENPPEDRVRAARLLGELALCMKAPKGQIARLQETVTNVLRKVQALSLEADFPDRGELLCSLGKLVSSPAASREADTVITRTLLETARGTNKELIPRALEGLTYVAASRRATPDLIHGTAELLKLALDQTVLEIETGTSRVDGETVIEIKGGENYTKVLPIVLKGMSRLACAGSCPPPIMRDIGQVLIARWKKIARGELIWGPANNLLVVQALRDLGCHKSFACELRLEILKCFAPQHVQTSIMHALTEILAADDIPGSDGTSPTAIGALTIGYAILGRRGKDGQLPQEDRQDILKALTRIAARKLLGSTTGDGQSKADAFRRRTIEELFKGLSDLLPACYESIVLIRDKGVLASDCKDDVERRLREYHSIV